MGYKIITTILWILLFDQFSLAQNYMDSLTMVLPTGHSEGVLKIDISPNGNYAASFDASNRLIIWNRKFKKELIKEQFNEAIHEVVFTNDSNLIIFIDVGIIKYSIFNSSKVTLVSDWTVKKATNIDNNEYIALTESKKIIKFQINLNAIKYKVLNENVVDYDFNNENLWILHIDGKIRLNNHLIEKSINIKNAVDSISNPTLIRGTKKDNVIVGYKNGIVLKHYLRSNKIDTILIFDEKLNNLISIKDEKYWIGISDDFSIKIKNCISNIEKSNFLNDYCTDVAIFQNEIWISSWDGTITIVNIDLKELYCLKSKIDKVIYFEKISKWQVALGYDNGKVSIINRSTGEIENIIKANSRISSISYDVSNEYLLVGTYEGDLYTYSFLDNLVIDTTTFEEEIVAIKVNTIERNCIITTFSHVYLLDYTRKIIDTIKVQSPWFTTLTGNSFYVACKGGFVKTEPNKNILLFDSLKCSVRNELVIDVVRFDWDDFNWTITYEGNLYKVYEDTSIFIINIGESSITNFYGSKSDSCIYIITNNNKIYRYSPSGNLKVVFDNSYLKDTDETWSISESGDGMFLVSSMDSLFIFQKNWILEFKVGLGERICCTPDSRRSGIIVGDSMEIMALSTAGKFYWFNLNDSSYLNYYDVIIHRSMLNNLCFNVDLNRINIKKTPFTITSSNNTVVAYYIDLENNNWLVKLTNSPYYMCSKEASRLLHYVTPSLKVIGFEQLDPVYNRPDIVLDSLGRYFGGVDQDLVAYYRQTLEKRIYRLGLDHEILGKGEIAVPSAEIIGADGIEYENKIGKVKIKVSANDPKYSLRRFNVYINEVPYYGSKGLSIEKMKTHEWDTTLTIPLNVGYNKIQVSVMNELGLENFKYSTYVNYTPKKEIISKIYYIGIGVDKFKYAGHDLKYCVKDVTNLANWFVGPNTEVKLYADSQVVKENILDLKEYLKNTGVNDKVIISCSSHGLLDDNLNFYLAMHDTDFKNPKARGLKYEELESLLDSIPARQKLLLLDACNSGENDKAELLKKDLYQSRGNMDSTQIRSLRGAIIQVEEENLRIFKKMNELFINVRNKTGSVIISAAGGQESALEGIKLDGRNIKNGAFTYSILECLKHYKGKDLMVSTLKQYTEHRVEEITEGKQKPTSRQETMEIDWIINDFMIAPKNRCELN